MIRHTVTLAALAALLPAGRAIAQGNERVINELAKQNQFFPPACSAAIGDAKANDAAKALRNAINEKDPASRKSGLAEAQSKAREAAASGKGATGWIYLGRSYLYAGDLVGADTAFTRGEKLAADCKEDINRFREAAWVPLVNAGVDFVNASKTDSALALFQQANIIYRDKPNAYAGVGAIYANQGNNDSAIVYLQKATEVAAANKQDEDRNVTAYNLGLVQTRAKRYEDAVKTLEQYHTWAPNDVQGAKALAAAYRGAGQADKAAALEKEAGLPPGEVPGAGDKSNELFQQGVAAFDAGKFAEAGDLFGQVYAAQPYNHDALVNQATAYYKAKDAAKLLAAAEQLVAVEPLNDIGQQLLMEAYRSAKQPDKQIETTGRRLAMPVKLETRGVKLSPTNVELTLMATGREARNARGAAIPPKSTALVFELLGSGDAVLATQEVTVPALKPDATHEVKVAAQANGITGWRYKVAS
ncbi:MAG TPA: tetratricopeptide repeat protein [Gemmatimonadales bacterium]|nr:tetratricopeptide repeat protein [Gemmatimonadales bacterium]